MADSVNDTDLHPAAKSEQLAEQLLAWIKTRQLQRKFERIIIAFSGGVDSTALVIALSQIRKQLTMPLLAVHVNHQLHTDADDWQKHCQSLCADLKIPIECIQANIQASSRRGLEALAREARYTALAEIAGNNNLLLTGQHADDQAETLLLHLLRGSGVDGLAAIHSLRPWNRGYLGRPFLNHRKSQLVGFVQNYHKDWIEDSSNAELQHRRNYLRHQILPALAAKWPQAVTQLNQAARHCQEAQSNLYDLAEIDLSQLQTNTHDQQLERLPLAGFCQLPPRRQRLLLRSWIRLQDWLTPGKKKLADFLNQLQQASISSSCEMRWLQHRMAVHGDYLYLNASFNSVEDMSIYPFTDFPGWLGKLTFNSEIESSQQKYQVSSRSGGEVIKLAGRKGSQSLKNIFQEAKIPTWLRHSIPLLWQQNKLLAIGDLWLAEDFAEDLQRAGVKFSWQPNEKSWQVFRDVIIATRH